MNDESIPNSRLFRESYLPGGIVLLRNGAFGKVIGARNNSYGMDHVDKAQLLDVIRNYVSAWDSMDGAEISTALRDSLSSGNMVFQCPSDVFVSPFPLLLQCNICKVLDFYAKIGEDATLNKIRGRLTHGDMPRVRCKRPSCKGHMVQLRYVSVHRCGSVHHISIPGQAMAVPNVSFLDRGGSFIGSSFSNLDTEEKISNALSQSCPPCKNRYEDRDGAIQRGTPTTGGESFYSHTVQYLSFDEKDGELLTDMSSHFQADVLPTGIAMDFAEGIVAALLNLVAPAEFKKNIKKLLHEGTHDEATIKDIQDKIAGKRTVLEKYASMEGDELFASMLDSVRKEIQDLESQLSCAQGLFCDVRKHVDDGTLVGAIAIERRAQEAAFFRQAFNEYTMKKRLEDEVDLEIRESISQQWSKLKASYGVDDVIHISDLNVVLVALGYTREMRTPYGDMGDDVPVILQPFEDYLDKNISGKSVAYAMSAKTEALHIRFDPRKILKWCHDEFGLAVPDPAIFKDKAAAHAHLLKSCQALRMSPSAAVRETADLPLAESAPFHLMHTISHCLLSVIKRHTGYDELSLGEYLFPQDLSILIYVTSVQNYTAGGLMTLFKHYLLPWFDDASNFAFQCVFDPVCSDSGCACNGCVQRVLGCETFNQGVSRAYLFGGETGQENNHLIVKKGFWY